ncbi:MAG TPA: hypothetical protein VKT99_16710 [Xanthobacteraceae bacterium]|jgi:hypothetical protein|nr:hypothetical protein [Xanthobacteraceae bacterium]
MRLPHRPLRLHAETSCALQRYRHMPSAPRQSSFSRRFRRRPLSTRAAGEKREAKRFAAALATALAVVDRHSTRDRLRSGLEKIASAASGRIYLIFPERHFSGTAHPKGVIIAKYIARLFVRIVVVLADDALTRARTLDGIPILPARNAKFGKEFKNVHP